MNPDLYAALPSKQKQKCLQPFPRPVYIPSHVIDSHGWVWRWMEPLRIPDEWLKITKELDEINTIKEFEDSVSLMGGLY